MKIRSFLPTFMALLLASGPVLADSAQSSLWQDRRRATQPTQVASLAGLRPDAGRMFQNLPRPQSTSLSPSLSNQLSRFKNPDLKKRLGDVVRALPAQAGSVRDVVSATGKSDDRIVIHIQDVHMNNEAQTNIGEAIRQLGDAGVAGVVGLEGSFEPLDLAFFRKFPDRQTMRDVAGFLLRNNEISGPVNVGMTEDHAPPMVGVDSPEHYNANVEAYRRAAPLRKKIEARVAEQERALVERKKSTFSAALLAFDNSVSSYEKGELPLGRFIRVLARASDDLPLSIETFQAAYDIETKLDFARVESERSRLLAALVRKLTKEDIDRLVTESLEYRAGRVSHGAFYASLRALAARHGVELTAYPSVDAYIRYVLLTDGIRSADLFRDMNALRDSGFTALAETPAQKTLVAESEGLRLVGKLVAFSLTPDEWERYTAQPKNLSASLGTLTDFESFYREADARNDALAANLLKAMDAQKTRVGILVTGGYHSPGIESRFARAGLSTVSYVPRLTKVDGDGSAYLSVFAQEKAPLDELFEGPKLFLAKDPLSVPAQRVATVLPLVPPITRPAPTFGDIRDWVRGKGWTLQAVSKEDDGRFMVSYADENGRSRQTLVRRVGDEFSWQANGGGLRARDWMGQQWEKVWRVGQTVLYWTANTWIISAVAGFSVGLVVTFIGSTTVPAVVSFGIFLALLVKFFLVVISALDAPERADDSFPDNRTFKQEAQRLWTILFRKEFLASVGWGNELKRAFLETPAEVKPDSVVDLTPAPAADRGPTLLTYEQVIQRRTGAYLETAFRDGQALRGIMLKPGEGYVQIRFLDSPNSLFVRRVRLRDGVHLAVQLSPKGEPEWETENQTLLLQDGEVATVGTSENATFRPLGPGVALLHLMIKTDPNDGTLSIEDMFGGGLVGVRVEGAVGAFTEEKGVRTDDSLAKDMAPAQMVLAKADNAAYYRAFALRGTDEKMKQVRAREDRIRQLLRRLNRPDLTPAERRRITVLREYLPYLMEEILRPRPFVNQARRRGDLFKYLAFLLAEAEALTQPRPETLTPKPPLERVRMFGMTMEPGATVNANTHTYYLRADNVLSPIRVRLQVSPENELRSLVLERREGEAFVSLGGISALSLMGNEETGPAVAITGEFILGNVIAFNVLYANGSAARWETLLPTDMSNAFLTKYAPVLSNTPRMIRYGQDQKEVARYLAPALLEFGHGVKLAVEPFQDGFNVTLKADPTGAVKGFPESGVIKMVGNFETLLIGKDAKQSDVVIPEDDLPFKGMLLVLKNGMLTVSVTSTVLDPATGDSLTPLTFSPLNGSPLVRLPIAALRLPFVSDLANKWFGWSPNDGKTIVVAAVVESIGLHYFPSFLRRHTERSWHQYVGWGAIWLSSVAGVVLFATNDANALGYFLTGGLVAHLSYAFFSILARTLGYTAVAPLALGSTKTLQSPFTDPLFGPDSSQVEGILLDVNNPDSRIVITVPGESPIEITRSIQKGAPFPTTRIAYEGFAGLNKPVVEVEDGGNANIGTAETAKFRLVSDQAYLLQIQVALDGRVSLTNAVPLRPVALSVVEAIGSFSVEARAPAPAKPPLAVRPVGRGVIVAPADVVAAIPRALKPQVSKPRVGVVRIFREGAVGIKYTGNVNLSLVGLADFNVVAVENGYELRLMRSNDVVSVAGIAVDKPILLSRDGRVSIQIGRQPSDGDGVVVSGSAKISRVHVTLSLVRGELLIVDEGRNSVRTAPLTLDSSRAFFVRRGFRPYSWQTEIFAGALVEVFRRYLPGFLDSHPVRSWHQYVGTSLIGSLSFASALLSASLGAPAWNYPLYFLLGGSIGHLAYSAVRYRLALDEWGSHSMVERRAALAALPANLQGGDIKGRTYVVRVALSERDVQTRVYRFSDAGVWTFVARFDAPVEMGDRTSLSDDGQTFTAPMRGSSPTSPVAVFRFNGEKIQALQEPSNASAEARLGEALIAAAMSLGANRGVADVNRIIDNAMPMGLDSLIAPALMRANPTPFEATKNFRVQPQKVIDYIQEHFNDNVRQSGLSFVEAQRVAAKLSFWLGDTVRLSDMDLVAAARGAEDLEKTAAVVARGTKERPARIIVDNAAARAIFEERYKEALREKRLFITTSARPIFDGNRIVSRALEEAVIAAMDAQGDLTKLSNVLLVLSNEVSFETANLAPGSPLAQMRYKALEEILKDVFIVRALSLKTVIDAARVLAIQA